MIDLGIDKILNEKETFDNFPIDVFPEQITDYINELQNKMGANPNFMAAAFLCICGISINRSKAIILKDSWREWCMLWIVIIGESGDKKTPSTNAMMNPLKKIARDKYKLFEEKQKAMSEDVTASPPVLERFFTPDATIEQYINLHSQNKKGLAIIMGEIASLISNSGKYTGGRGSDIEKYLQAFSYEDLSSDRKIAKSSHLPNAHLNIFGGIQPNVLSACMTAHLQDNGFWDRFLFVSGNKRSGYLTKEDVDPVVKDDYDSYVTGLYELINESQTPEPEEDIPVDFYRLNKEAFDYWFDYNHNIEKLIGFESDLDSRTKSAYSKMATYFGRFILLFHTLDTVYVYPFQKLQFKEVKIESVEKAIRLLKYFMHQYDLVAKEAVAKKESINVLSDTKGMSNKEKAQLLKEKYPEWTHAEVGKALGVTRQSVDKYFK